jgi:hypothetical protein
MQWVAGTLLLGVKRPGREADHSPPSSGKVKNAWTYIFTPQYVFMAWCLVKHRANFTLLHFYVCIHSAYIIDEWYRTRLRAGWVPAGAGNFSLHCRVQTGFGAHRASIPMGTRGSFLGVRWAGREANHSPQSSSEVKNAWSHTSTLNTPSWSGPQLKHRYLIYELTFFLVCKAPGVTFWSLAQFKWVWYFTLWKQRGHFTLVRYRAGLVSPVFTFLHVSLSFLYEPKATRCDDIR